VGNNPSRRSHPQPEPSSFSGPVIGGISSMCMTYPWMSTPQLLRCPWWWDTIHRHEWHESPHIRFFLIQLQVASQLTAKCQASEVEVCTISPPAAWRFSHWPWRPWRSLKIPWWHDGLLGPKPLFWDENVTPSLLVNTSHFSYPILDLQHFYLVSFIYTQSWRTHSFCTQLPNHTQSVGLPK